MTVAVVSLTASTAIAGKTACTKL